MHGQNHIKFIFEYLACQTGLKFDAKRRLLSSQHFTLQYVPTTCLKEITSA